MREHVWIVEVKFEGRPKWEPTVGCALSRLEGGNKLAEWQAMCPDDEFRLTRYESTKDNHEEN